MPEPEERVRRRMHDPNDGRGFAHPEEMRVSSSGAMSPGGVSLLASGVTTAALAAWRGWRRWRERG